MSAEITKAEQLRTDAEKRFSIQQAAALTTYAYRVARTDHHPIYRYREDFCANYCWPCCLPSC